MPEAYGVNQMGSAGWEPKEPSVTVTELEPGMPAEKAGMKVGDEIVDAGRPADSRPGAMIETLKRTKDKPIEITVSRDGQPHELHGAAGVGRRADWRASATASASAACR